MEATEGKTDYKKRLEHISRNKRYYSHWDVSERLKAKGVTKGSSMENVRSVLTKRVKVNLLVIQAAEEVIKIRQQIHVLRPIALMSKALIIEEYTNSLETAIVE